MARWHSCIVLDAGNSARHLWQFAAGGDKFTLQRHESRLAGEPLPEKVVGKDWPTLLQPKLNIAWLPPEEVFLRVIQLPKSDFAETQAMIDLQLEKLSPLPAAQMVWSFETFPQTAGDMQTAVVIIASRTHVEQFLGQLETEGYLADRLEVPLVDQLRATQINDDGVWIYPGLGADNYSCLVAWWYGGTLCNLSLLKLPAGDQQALALREHLTQIAWAGEIEGWLLAPPHYHLVISPENAAPWKAAFNDAEQVNIIPPIPPDEVAALTARRAATEERRINLLPPEYTARYRQQLIDRLWMRALGAMIVLYLCVIAVYLGWAQIAHWQYNKVNATVSGLGPSYTNTIRLKEEVKVLQDQINLQFAALDTWKAVTDNLPPELMLESLGFESGRKITIRGTVPSDNVKIVYEFLDRLQNASVRAQPLFSKVEPGRISAMPNNVSGWVVHAELKQTEL